MCRKQQDFTQCCGPSLFFFSHSSLYSTSIPNLPPPSFLSDFSLLCLIRPYSNTILSASEGLTLQKKEGERRGGDSYSTHIKLLKNSADTLLFTPGSLAPLAPEKKHTYTHTHTFTHSPRWCRVFCALRHCRVV